MKYLFTCLLTSSVILLFSQQGNEHIDPCGTGDISPEQLEFLQNFVANYSEIMVNATENIQYVPVVIHAVADDDGNGRLPYDKILTIICEVNVQFQPANMYFYLKDINEIDNTTYFRHTFQAGANMMSVHNVSNVLNMYLVEEAGGACGYYSHFGQAIAIMHGCAQPGNTTVAHEIGHYFSLPHTFRGWEGRTISNPPPSSSQEHADGSNCSSAGDLFCDTPADYISYRWNCPYSGPELKDPTGSEISPDPSNFMSYSSDHCQNQFSNQQIGAMRAYLSSARAGHLSHPVPSTHPVANVVPVFPIQDEEAPSNEITFTWEKADNATRYHLIVSRFMSFTLPVVDVIVTDTFFHAQDLNLLEGVTYRYKIKPFSPGYTCASYTNVQSFVAGNPVNTNIENPTEVSRIEKMKIYPNPVTFHETAVFLVFSATLPGDGLLEIYDTQGSLLKKEPVRVLRGENKHQITLSQLPAGIYILRFQNDDSVLTRRIVVQ